MSFRSLLLSAALDITVYFPSSKDSGLKQIDILKVLAKEFGSNDVLKLNQALKEKADEKIKFKIMGKNLGYLGFTVILKKIESEGLKIFDIGKVRLVRYLDIDSFEKAKTKIPRPVYLNAKKTKKLPKVSAAPKFKVEEDFGELPAKTRIKPTSNFIPKTRRR